MKLKFLEEYRNKKIKYEELAILNGISVLNLREIFKKNKIVSNKFLLKDRVKQDFFKIIDTEEKAYFLGLMASDGSVSSSGRISLSLSEKDSYLIEIFKKIINSDHKLCTNKKKIDNFGYSSKPMVSFAFSSQEMSADLALHGVIPNKTYTGLSLPNIQKDLILHFFRGYFDGDGSISISEGVRKDGFKYKNSNFSITSKTRSILDDFSKILFENCINNKISKYKNKECFSLIVSGFRNCEKLKHILYENSTIFLKRKRDKFDLIPSQKKYTGVFFNKKLKKYRVSFEFNKINYYFGLFENLDDAILEADKRILYIKGPLSFINHEENRLIFLKESSSNNLHQY